LLSVRQNLLGNAGSKLWWSISQCYWICQ